MTNAASDRPAPALPLAAVCIAGALALAASQGIGRFAFTPLLPLMQRDGLLGSDGGGLLAAINYAGYLAGALLAGRLARQPRRLVLAGLAGTTLLTAAMGLLHGMPAWLLLRGLGGVLSAFVMVGVSSWSIAELARRGRDDAGAWVFAGVGLGIAAAGLLPWWGAGLGSSALWLALAGVALLLGLAVQACWRPQPAATSVAASGPAGGSVPPGSAGLVFCYGSFGFGYILPATYLPVLARQLVDDPRVFGFAWPLFGLAAIASTLLAGRALRRWHQFQVWAACQLLMALGTALALLGRSAWAIGASALCVGGSFMVATMAGLQLARRHAAQQPAPLLGRMTAAFAAGQIAGPLVAVALDRLRLPGWSGIELTLLGAAALLAATAAWLYNRSLSTKNPSDAHSDAQYPRTASH